MYAVKLFDLTAVETLGPQCAVSASSAINGTRSSGEWVLFYRDLDGF
jgi:hypothetical protein